MFNLVTAVMAVALTALVVAGGSTFLRSDFGLRRMTTEQVYLSYRSFDSAVSAFRISNNGALPLTSASPATQFDAAPWWQVRPYLAGEVQTAGVNGTMSTPPGMDWFYVSDASSASWLCLQTTGAETAVPDAVRGALEMAALRVPSSTISSACDSPDSPPTATRIALRLRVQSAGL